MGAEVGASTSLAAAGYRLTWITSLPYPVRNTLRRWKGMVGMMIGVGIALGVTMTLLAVARASVDYYTIDFKRSAADLYVVTQGGTLIPILPSDTPGTIKHARNVLSQLRAMPEVSAAVGFMSWPLVREREGPKRSDEPTELIQTVGIDGDPSSIPGALVLNEGRWVRRSNELVIGPKLSREKGVRLGDSMRLGGRDFSIVGVGKLRGLGAGFAADAIVYVDYRALRDRADIGDIVSMVAVDARNPAAVRERIKDLGSLSSFSTDDLIAQAETVNAAAMGIYWVLIVLTLAIAGLFVNNMLAHSVSERRLEFATLRAIGIPSNTILMTVGGEAVLIGLVASAIAIALSLFLGVLLNQLVAPAYSIEFLYSADAMLFGLVVILALGLGVGSGLLPARRATRVDPVEVLREA